MDQQAQPTTTRDRTNQRRAYRTPRRPSWTSRRDHRDANSATHSGSAQLVTDYPSNQYESIATSSIVSDQWHPAPYGADDKNTSNDSRRPTRRSAQHYSKRRHPNRGLRSSHATTNSLVSEQSQDVETENIPQQVHDYRRGRGGRQNSRVARSRFEPLESRQEQANEITVNTLTNVQSEIVESQLRGNDFECMICCDNISRASSIWCCPNCYNIFHLKCSIEWCNKSIKSRQEALASAAYPSLGQTNTRSDFTETSTSSFTIDSSTGQARTRDIVEWPCPACREVLFTRPSKYLCFCGKVSRPEVNIHLTPHSCGKLCNRKRPNANCPHTCNSICHPGKCLPCNLNSMRSCFCGKTTEDMKCTNETQSCNQVCGKTLACGSHTCARLCHPGSCDDCNEIMILTCHCGQDLLEQLCKDIPRNNGVPKLNFSCGRLCDKILDCEKHRCEKRCHPGPECPSCKFLSKNIQFCPCGSTSVKKSLLDQRTSCLDPLPTCDNKCYRSLICGPEKNHHRCQKKCHTGSCPPCKLKSTVHCECKLTTKSIDCNSMFKKESEGDKVTFKQVQFTFNCEARCNKLKSCGRHRCYNKCCQHLRAPSIHICDQICGKKLACGEHSCPEVCHFGQCGDCTNIGWEELSCHCGSSVLYPPIPCGAKPPICNRPCRRPHKCGHPVKHECHNDTESCAPCTVFVKKKCFCGADSKESVYCYLTGYSCGRTCKKRLSCGRHTCTRVCHENECEQPEKPICTKPCPVVRFSCKHTCSLPCHRSTPCPISDCKEQIKISCECGNKTDRIDCYKITRDVDNRNRMLMMNTSRSSQESTIIIDLTKKQTTDSMDQSEIQTKRLDCDETCSILKRNKALAEALDIAEPDLKPASIFGEDPLKLIREATAQDYKFVAATYNSLARFVKQAKESDRRFIFMQFPPANKLRREIVHELAHHFNCTSESRDEEPFKHVVVRAYKNKSCVPDFNIEQLLPVED